MHEKFEEMIALMESYRERHNDEYDEHWQDTGYSDLYSCIASFGQSKCYFQYMNINLLARLFHSIIKQAANAKNCWHSEFDIDTIEKEFFDTYDYGVDKLLMNILSSAYAVGDIRPYSMFAYFAHIVENRGFDIDEVIDIYRRKYGNA